MNCDMLAVFILFYFLFQDCTCVDLCIRILILIYILRIWRWFWYRFFYNYICIFCMIFSHFYLNYFFCWLFYVIYFWYANEIVYSWYIGYTRVWIDYATLGYTEFNIFMWTEVKIYKNCHYLFISAAFRSINEIFTFLLIFVWIIVSLKGNDTKLFPNNTFWSYNNMCSKAWQFNVKFFLSKGQWSLFLCSWCMQ